MKYLIRILLSGVLFWASSVFAQTTCTGSLGDPIINITFGQGNNPGAPLPISVPGASTSYTYVAPTGNPPANIILDGNYSLVNATPPNPGWLQGTDHTGNASGYMAFFNAAPNPGEFYRQTVSGLCSGTTYEFAAWILNAINSNVIPGAVPPNVTFRIYNPSNLITPLIVFSTGDIPAANIIIWHQYSTLFTTPSGINSVILTLSNNNVGGTSLVGNDLAIDDITFRACGPLTTASFSSTSSISSAAICENFAFTVYGTVGAGLTTPAYQWQVSNNNGVSWSNITGATALTYSSSFYTPGIYKLRLASQESANILSPFCKFFSNIIDLTVKSKSFSTINAAICDGQNYAGHTTAGTYMDTYTAANGCDSIRTLNLTVKPGSFTTNNQSVCEGQTYQGHNATGTYVTTLVAANGCDSIYTLNLIVKPKSFTTNNQSICEGQNYQGHNTTGTYVTTLVAANGCDSIYTLNLTVKPKSFTTNNQSICEGQNFEGHTATGTYVSTLIAANGCDSVYTLNLIVKPKSFSTINAAICDGQTYAGHTIAGSYMDTYTAANGCDSIRTLNLTVKPRSFTTNNQSVCEGQTYQGHNVTGTYVTILVAANGCDSIYTLNLIVKPKSFTTNNQSICEGQTYEGHNATGTYITTLVAANGCDSIYTLNLTVKPKSFTTNNQSICEGQSYEGHTTTGTYISTLIAANGCDSIYTLNLMVKPKSFSTINAAICDGQTYAGHTISGSYMDTYTAANGCDSIRTLNLTVKPRSFTTNNQSVCEGQTYQGHNVTGTYVTTLAAANGCDSIYTLNLIVEPKSFTTNNQSICEGQSYEGHNVSGTYITTLIAANGCDSVYTLNLSVKPKSFTTNNQSICEGQSYEGHNATGTFITTLIGANGCDSVYTLNLIIKLKSFSNINAAICAGQTYAGHASAGTYIDTYIAANGCDSIRTLILTVKPLPLVNTIPDTTICISQILTLTTTGASTYSWLPALQLSDPNSSSPQFFGNPGHKYYVTGTMNGCSNKDSVTITVKSAASLIHPPDKSFCSKKSVQLDGYNGNSVSYLWAGSNLSNLNIKSPIANPQLSTVYSVKITDNFCNYDTIFFVSVSVLPLPTIKASSSNNINCAVLSSYLTVTGGITYTWSPIQTLNNSNSPNPIATPTASTTYYVTGLGSNGCGNKDSITILKSSLLGDIYIPNTFSPNGDNKNDCFHVMTNSNIDDFNILIYDRWGTKVYESHRFSDCWDGKFKGQDALPGNYVFYLNAKTPCGNFNKTGNLLLLR